MVSRRGGHRLRAPGSGGRVWRRGTAAGVRGVAWPARRQTRRWSGISPSCLIVQGFQVREEIVVVLEPPDAARGKVRVGFAEPFLPGRAVNPGVLLGDDAGQPAPVAGENRGDMAVGGQVDELRKVLAGLGSGHLLDLVRQRHRVLAHVPSVRYVRSVYGCSVYGRSASGPVGIRLGSARAPRCSHRYPGCLPFPDIAGAADASPDRRCGGEESELRVSLVGVSCVGTTTIGRILATG